MDSQSRKIEFMNQKDGLTGKAVFALSFELFFYYFFTRRLSGKSVLEL